MSRVILCETPDGCTCGAPASTPTGMHHCDCAIHPGWCGQPTCLPCDAWEAGWHEHYLEWEAQEKDPRHPITKRNPHREGA